MFYMHSYIYLSSTNDTVVIKYFHIDEEYIFYANITLFNDVNYMIINHIFCILYLLIYYEMLMD